MVFGETAEKQNLAHINFIGYYAGMAALHDPDLRKHPYIIAGRAGGQDIVADVSPIALGEGIVRGMPLVHAQRLVKDLTIAAPDIKFCRGINETLEKIISRYSSVWQNDGAGNIYIDITGTRRLYGPPADCVCKIQNEILNKIKIDAAAAAGSNKLVCKVASRTIRPEGLIEVSAGDEASFLSRQDITLLPGLGPSLMKTIRVTGFSQIGEIAALTDTEALSLFGKKGILLRDNARGIDNSPVAGAGSRKIESRADFSEDVIDDTVLRGALTSLAEHAGLEMRRDKLGTTEINLKVFYADGLKAEGKEKPRRACILDRDIALAAHKIFQKIIARRIRIRSVVLSLEGLMPLGFEPDLFEPETETKGRKLQEAVDSIQSRYGAGKVTRGIVLAAVSAGNRTLCALTS